LYIDTHYNPEYYPKPFKDKQSSDPISWKTPPVKSEKLRIVPNPNDGSFTLKYPVERFPSYYLRIEGINGAMVYEEKGDNELGFLSLRMADLTPGVYTIKMENGDNSLREKLVIVK
jgi:hypothetical protein